MNTTTHARIAWCLIFAMNGAIITFAMRYIGMHFGEVWEFALIPPCALLGWAEHVTLKRTPLRKILFTETETVTP